MGEKMKEHNLTTYILSVGLVLVVLTLVFQTFQTEENTIVIDGQHKVTVSPDEGLVYLQINSVGPTAIDAERSNKDASNRVIDALKSLGLKNEEIETDYYNLGEKMRWNNNNYISDGYEASHTLKIRTKDLTNIGKIIQTATENGANRINNIQFTLSDEKREEEFQKAIAKATENARKRAEALGDAAGFEIKKVKSVTLNSPRNIYPVYYESQALMSADGKVDNGATIQPEQVDFDVNVDVTFIIS